MDKSGGTVCRERGENVGASRKSDHHCRTRWRGRTPRRCHSRASRLPGCRDTPCGVQSRGSGPEWGSLRCRGGQSSRRCRRTDAASPSSHAWRRQQDWKTRLSCKNSVSWGSIIFILFESPQLFPLRKGSCFLTRRSRRCRWTRPERASSVWSSAPRFSAAGPRWRCSGSWSGEDEQDTGENWHPQTWAGVMSDSSRSYLALGKLLLFPQLLQNSTTCWRPWKTTRSVGTVQILPTSDGGLLTWGRGSGVVLRGLRSHQPLLQTVDAALQLSLVSLQGLHRRLQSLGHSVFSS